MIRQLVQPLIGFAMASILTLGVAGALGQTKPAYRVPISDETPAQLDARLQWWRDARFGMFIHWGPVSLKGTEIGWSRGAPIPIEEYDGLYKEFNPEKFNADEWVSVAKAAGMKYIVLTTKHHDGFCLWDTKQTDHNIMNSPFKRDVCRELADACRKQGIRFCTYYSVTDWYSPLHPQGSPGGKTRKPTGDIEKYDAYLRAQVKELITSYGPLGIMWFDVPQSYDAARGKSLYDYVRSLQPDIIINDRTGGGGDYLTPEQKLGAFNNTQPWETCMTICRQWAWKPKDNMKSLQQCIQSLVICAAGDGNFLFNVGPMPTGEIEARQVERLKEMGKWMDQFGSTIYGTRGGPFKPGRNVVSTCKGNSIFVHVLNWETDPVVLPNIPAKITASECLTGGKATVQQTDKGITISVDAANRNAIDTIIRLDLDQPASAVKPVAAKPSGPVS